MHISHHNGTRNGDVNDTDWQEAQVRQGVEPRDGLWNRAPKNADQNSRCNSGLTH